MTDKAWQLVTSTLQEMAAELGYEGLSSVTADTALYGGTDGIDSLSLVMLIAELERVATEKLDRRIVLADDRALSRRSSPFRTVGTLVEFVREQLERVDG